MRQKPSRLPVRLTPTRSIGFCYQIFIPLRHGDVTRCISILKLGRDRKLLPPSADLRINPIARYIFLLTI